MKDSPKTCPNCGADLPKNARACPECGSDEETGWSDEASVGALGLPDDNFDYDEFVENEFGERREPKPKGLSWLWWCVGVAVLAVIFYVIFRTMIAAMGH